MGSLLLSVGFIALGVKPRSRKVILNGYSRYVFIHKSKQNKLKIFPCRFGVHGVDKTSPRDFLEFPIQLIPVCPFEIVHFSFTLSFIFGFYIDFKMHRKMIRFANVRGIIYLNITYEWALIGQKDVKSPSFDVGRTCNKLT